MTVGTPGFVGARLREAREARSIASVAALAEMLDVSRVMVSQYENGAASPSPDSMQRITEVLNLPVTFFCRPEERSVGDKVFERSMSAATKGMRVRNGRRLGWLVEITQYLREFVEVPPVSFPSIATPSDPRELTKEHIADAAEATRRHWGLGDRPISSVAWLLENHGAIVTRSHVDAHALDAFSTWSPRDEAPYVFLGNDKNSAARSRFDAGHELAHMVLHRQVPPTLFHDLAVFKLVEMQANYFASTFLLPARKFSSDVDSVYGVSLNSLRVLKRKWGVSIQAMVTRAFDLGLISEGQRDSLWYNIGRRHWRLREPLDDELTPEQPRVLERGFEVVLAQGVSREDILASLPFSAGDIEDLAGLSPGFLEEPPPNVTVLPVRDRRESQSKPFSGEASVTQLRFGV